MLLEEPAHGAKTGGKGEVEGRGDKNQWPASVFTSHLAISGRCRRQWSPGKHGLRLTRTEVLCVTYSVSRVFVSLML